MKNKEVLLLHCVTDRAVEKLLGEIQRWELPYQVQVSRNKREFEQLAPHAGIVLVCTLSNSTGTEEEALHFVRWIRSHRRFYTLPILLVQQNTSPEANGKYWAYGVDEILDLTKGSQMCDQIVQLFGRPQRRTNLTYLDPFLRATQRLFQQRGFVVSAEFPCYTSPKEPAEGQSITSFLGITGSHRGSFQLSLQEEVGWWLLKNFFEIAESSREYMLDGVGEFANLIVGQAKKELKKSGISFSFSVPSVVIGSDYQVIAPESKAAIFAKVRWSEGQAAVLRLILHEVENHEEDSHRR